MFPARVPGAPPRGAGSRAVSTESVVHQVTASSVGASADTAEALMEEIVASHADRLARALYEPLIRLLRWDQRHLGGAVGVFHSPPL